MKKEKWLANSELISQELITVIDKKVQLFLYTEEEPTGLITTASQIYNYNGEDYLIIQNDGGLKVGQRGFVAYRKQNGEMSHGFSLEIRKSTQKQVAISLPDEIFQIQRRQYSRVTTHGLSELNFYLRGQEIRNTMTVLDIAMTSARLGGIPRQRLAAENKLERLTFQLSRKLYQNVSYPITIRSAVVEKIKMNRQILGEIEVVICFQPSLVEKDQLDLYIESRLWESALYVG